MTAATYDVTIGSNGALPALANGYKIVSRKINLQDLVELASQTVAETNDIFQVLDVPANTHVLYGGIIPLTAEGTTLTISLGDGSQAAGFCAALDMNALTAAMTIITDAYGAGTAHGHFYGSADTIDIKIASMGAQTSHLAEFVVWAAMGKIPTTGQFV